MRLLAASAANAAVLGPAERVEAVAVLVVVVAVRAEVELELKARGRPLG